jgi:hypothetical protein
LCHNAAASSGEKIVKVSGSETVMPCAALQKQWKRRRRGKVEDGNGAASASPPSCASTLLARAHAHNALGRSQPTPLTATFTYPLPSWLLAACLKHSRRKNGSGETACAACSGGGERRRAGSICAAKTKWRNVARTARSCRRLLALARLASCGGASAALA